MNDPISTPPAAPKPARAWSSWLTGAALATAFLAGGLTVSGLSAAAQEAGQTGGGMHGMMMGGDHMQAMAHINAALDAVGATDDQKARIKTILHDGLGSLMTVHHEMGDTHEALIGLLSAPTIDRDALERLRVETMAKFDRASRTLVQALADAAEVLRPEQRAKLADMMRAHHAHP
jgi:protein CpxP